MTEVIGAYQLLTDFTTAGGGQSRWAFARRDGREYFLKEFLKPKYPIDGAPGSETTKASQRTACVAFERHHRAIQKALRPLSASGGNLIVTVDFFREGTKYYKVTEKVEVTDWEPGDVMALPGPARLLLMLTVAHSLNVLHRAGLVHGDIKPPNILIKRLGDDASFGTKLIDFDNAVLAKEPLPPPDQLVGDMAYYSPELVRYINDPKAGGRLSGASDVFALGIVFSEWLTSHKPDFDPEARYAGVAAARGEILRPRGIEPEPLADLVAQMLSPVPSDRPRSEEVHMRLRELRPLVSADGPTAERAASVGGLQGSLIAKRGDTSRRKPSTDDGEVEKRPPPGSGLRGKLAARRPR